MLLKNQWKIKSIEGKQIERTVYLHPPKEANISSIQKLQECVYGLANASRYWYLRVKEELVTLGAKLSRVNPGIFYWQDDSGLIGILACH